MPSWRERASDIFGGKNGTRAGAGTFEGKWDSGDGTAGGAGAAALTRDEVITGLRCCTNEERQLCFECPEDGPGWGTMCKTDLMKAAARYLEEDRERDGGSTEKGRC